MRKKNSTVIFSASYKKRLILSIGKYRGEILKIFCLRYGRSSVVKEEGESLKCGSLQALPSNAILGVTTPSWGPLRHLGGH